MHRSIKAVELRVAGAAWLSDSAMLMVMCSAEPIDASTQARLVAGGVSTDLRTRGIALDGASQRWVVVAQGEGCVRARRSFDLLFGHSMPVVVGTDDLTDLRSLIRRELAPLAADLRGQVIDFLATCASDVPSDSAERLRLSRSLYLAREMLRERLPVCELRPSRIEGVAVESLMALDDDAFYIEGWLCEGESQVVRLTAVAPEGARTELLSRSFRYRRSDAEEYFLAAGGDVRSAAYGFICFFRLAAPSRLPSGWVIEVETAAGSVMEVPAPIAIRDYKRVRTELLNDLRHDHKVDRDLLRTHISPAVTALQTRRDRYVRVEHSAEFGRQPAAPEVSVLVPVYGRIDLVEHQVAQLADDPSFREAELIYVLDSPELQSDLLNLADGLHRLYRMPFRVLVLSENAGFSTANNVGASFARAGLLLLLNSDVMPARRGWLTELVRFFRSLERPGAVGPKLLYEDGSLQHAGLYFAETRDPRIRMNEHYFKGLDEGLPAANVARKVPAVTAACLLIDADLYRRVGGLSGKYVQGDYEDSDLCLRVWSEGYENWYCPQVSLYHLEGQSYPSVARDANTQYNRWLFNETWTGSLGRANAVVAEVALAPRQRRNGSRPARPSSQPRAKEVGVS
jgi:GT2 family glycosyltransferase